MWVKQQPAAPTMSFKDDWAELSDDDGVIVAVGGGREDMLDVSDLLGQSDDELEAREQVIAVDTDSASPASLGKPSAVSTPKAMDASKKRKASGGSASGKSASPQLALEPAD